MYLPSPPLSYQLTSLPSLLRNRAEALSTFQKSPFFLAWDPTSLELYVTCGTYLTQGDNGNEVAKLKMSGTHEAIVFSETHTEFEVYDRLPVLDERIKLRWVVPGKEGAPEFGPPGSTCRRVWVRPGNSTNVRIEGAGHLVCSRFVCVNWGIDFFFCFWIFVDTAGET